MYTPVPTACTLQYRLDAPVPTRCTLQSRLHVQYTPDHTLLTDRDQVAVSRTTTPMSRHARVPARTACEKDVVLPIRVGRWPSTGARPPLVRPLPSRNLCTVCTVLCAHVTPPLLPCCLFLPHVGAGRGRHLPRLASSSLPSPPLPCPRPPRPRTVRTVRTVLYGTYVAVQSVPYVLYCMYLSVPEPKSRLGEPTCSRFRRSPPPPLLLFLASLLRVFHRPSGARAPPTRRARVDARA